MSQQRSRGPRTPLPSASTGTLGVVVAVVALVLGFLILRDVRGDGGGGTVTPGGDSTTTVPGGGSVDPNATTTTAPFNIQAFKIQIVNASGIAGSAGDLTEKLQDVNYVVQPAMNTPPGTAKRSKTGVFYLQGCEANAQNVAGTLGGNVEIGPMPSPVPVETGTIGEACVLIVLGTDLSMKPLQGVVGTGNGAAAVTTTSSTTPPG